MKHVLKTFLVIQTLLLSCQAKADTTQDFKPFVGIEVSSINAGFASSVKDNVEPFYGAFGINVGAYVTNNFSVSLFYQKSSEEKKNWADVYAGEYGETKSDIKGYGVEGAFYFPLKNKKVSPFVSLGVGRYEMNAQPDSNLYHYYKISEKNLGTRLGFGAKVDLSENIAFKLGGRFTKFKTGKNDFLDDMFEMSFGLEKSF